VSVCVCVCVYVCMHVHVPAYVCVHVPRAPVCVGVGVCVLVSVCTDWGVCIHTIPDKCLQKEGGHGQPTPTPIQAGRHQHIYSK
jgi:hypothetical protein